MQCWECNIFLVRVVHAFMWFMCSCSCGHVVHVFICGSCVHVHVVHVFMWFMCSYVVHVFMFMWFMCSCSCGSCVHVVHVFMWFMCSCVHVHVFMFMKTISSRLEFSNMGKRPAEVETEDSFKFVEI